MDAHFNVYKARYDDLDFHLAQIRKTQYVKSIDIFINLDDVIHNLHRPQVEKEFELCGIKAPAQCASNIINLVAHYKRWATRAEMTSTVWIIYTSSSYFKNSAHIPAYRKYFVDSNALSNPKFMLLNSAMGKAIPIAKNICDYVSDVHMLDTVYLEPSCVPLYLRNHNLCKRTWSMMVSRDLYDLQYAYRDRWIFVSPKGDNTRIVTRRNLWDYMAAHEHIVPEDHNIAMYHHDILPLALAVAGNKHRSIPRLGRIGWKTIFRYLDQITAQDSVSGSIMGNRLLEILSKKKIPEETIQANFMVSSIETQAENITDIAAAFLRDQMKVVTDHEALSTINEMYFREFPLNLSFLTSNVTPSGPFAF